MLRSGPDTIGNRRSGTWQTSRRAHRDDDAVRCVVLMTWVYRHTRSLLLGVLMQAAYTVRAQPRLQVVGRRGCVGLEALDDRQRASWPAADHDLDRVRHSIEDR